MRYLDIVMDQEEVQVRIVLRLQPILFTVLPEGRQEYAEVQRCRGLVGDVETQSLDDGAISVVFADGGRELTRRRHDVPVVEEVLRRDLPASADAIHQDIDSFLGRESAFDGLRVRDVTFDARTAGER